MAWKERAALPGPCARGHVPYGRNEAIRWLAIAASVIAFAGATAARSAAAWKPSAWWLRQALCIHRHESVDWHRAGVDWRGRPSPYYGGMQFLVSTWSKAGGRGLPSSATPREQLHRAWVVWKRDGGSWHEWGTAGVCGLH